MTAGLYPGIPIEEYLVFDALSASRLSWMAVSPLYYQHRIAQPAVETESMALGKALHMAVLEPQRFIERYAPEPDLEAIGGAKPRATNAYREAVAAIEGAGQTVLREAQMISVLSMAEAVRGHEHAARILDRAPEREVSAVWARGDRLCRGRFDMLGDGVIADVKTTRDLARFSPWAITNHAYHAQLAWYRDGARRLGRKVDHVFLIAIESAPPWDCGVFVLDQFVLDAGMDRCEALVAKLDECERTNVWEGMYPTIQQGNIAETTNGESDEEAA